MAPVHRLAEVDVAHGHVVPARGVVSVEELRIAGDAVVELGAPGHVGVGEDVLPDDAAGIAHAVHVGDRRDLAVLEAGHVLLEEGGEPVHLTVLVDDLPGEVLHVVVAAVVGLGGVQGDVAALRVSARHRVDQQPRNEEPGKVAVGDGFVLLGHYELDAGLQLLRLLEGRLGLFVLLHVDVREPETHGDRLVEAAVLGVAHLAGHARREGQVGVAGAVDEDLGADLHAAALGIGDDRRSIFPSSTTQSATWTP